MKSIFFQLFILIILSVSCKKTDEKKDFSIYHYTVLDEFTNEPIANCIVTLLTYSYPAMHSYDTLGMTDSQGKFIYIFDKVPSNETQAYITYSLIFTKEHHSEYTTEELILTNEIKNPIIELNKYTTHAIVGRHENHDSESLYFTYYKSFFDLYGGFYDYPIGTDTTHYYRVPSNSNIYLIWGDSPGQKDNKTLLETGYDDTTYTKITY